MTTNQLNYKDESDGIYHTESILLSSEMVDEGRNSESSYPANSTVLSDDEILKKCQDGTEDLFEQEEREIDSNPLKFEMKGCTVNINDSRDIHFGTTIAQHPTDAPSVSRQFPSMSDLPTPCSSVDTISLSSMASSIGKFQKVPDCRDLKTMCNGTSPTTARRFSEGVPDQLPPSFHININSPTPNASNIVAVPSDSGDAADLASGPSKIIQRSVSTPVSDTSSQRSSLSPKSQTPIIGNTSLNQKHPGQMTAAITNSSNVQLGTQIVVNYILSDKDQCLPHLPEKAVSTGASHMQSANKVPNGESTKACIEEFRDKIISVYHKRTRSAPLPWHRGKQLIPINEYYTEPQIFTVGKCGNRTTETVNLIDILNSGLETRYLLEGEAGMGKTLLATKLAEDWAKGQHLQQFRILLLVTLGDFKGSLEQYCEELLPSYFDPEKFKQVWEYLKAHDDEILFVLDGYDELMRPDKGEIQNLIKSKDFPNSKVVVTSRPNILQDWEKKIVVTGFGQIQIMEFIEKYFRAIGNSSSGKSLRRIIEKDDKYWKLAKRPLFCVLLCMLYITGEVGESLPERQSDIMLQIILCLIKWNRKNNCLNSIDFESLPQEYEKPFYNFGKLCLNALKTEKTRFTNQEVQAVDGFQTKLKQLGFLYDDDESHALGEKKFWKPVHQTFLEYLGAFYMAKHIKDCRGCKECKKYGTIFQRSHEVLKFCVGILNNKAYKVLDGQRFKVLWNTPVCKMLYLLKEALPKPENFLAVAKLLDDNCVEISSSELEFEGWSYLLSQPFRRLTTLKIAWRIKSQSPDQESSFSEASVAQYSSFFQALKENDSIRCIQVRAKQDGEPFTEEKIAVFFSHLQTALMKKNLQELEIVEMKMTASRHLCKAIEGAAYQANKVRPLQDLRVLKIHTFMKDSDLKGICEALQKSAPSLESLHLEGLEHGNGGFKSLVRLLKCNRNIRYLHLSMNQSLFVDVFGSAQENTKDYPPGQMRTDHQMMTRTAVKKSKHAFNQFPEEDNANELGYANDQKDDASNKGSESPKRDRTTDPQKEFEFLFNKISLKDSPWSLEAKRYWYLNKRTCSDSRIPLPICVDGEHKSVFHYLFSALPETHVKNLTLNQAGLYLSTPDLICLGDAIRTAPHLAVLNLQVLDKVESYMPLLIGLGQSPALTSVNLSSTKIVINDATFEVMCASLQNNTSLRNLSLGKWQFHLQNFSEAKMHLSTLFGSWQVSHFDLNQCSIDISETLTPSQPPQTPTSPLSSPLTAFFSHPLSMSHPWRTLKTLNLDGVEIREPSGMVRRGHLLLDGLTNFVNLTSLDLSVSHKRPIQVDNIAIRRFFGLLGSEMKQLTELKLGSWEFCYQAKENNDISAKLKSCRRLKKLQLEKVNEVLPESINLSDSWCKNTFLHQLISYIPNLDELSLCYYRINNRCIDQDLASKIGNCLHDHFNHTPFSVKFFNLTQDIENILYQTLKKNPLRVKRDSGMALIKTFEVRFALRLRKRPIR